MDRSCKLSAALHESAQQEQFNEVAYEKERLEKNAEAMDAMKIVAENEFAKLRTPWKWEIRKRIWDMMEERNIAWFPRPVHHRIPNFVNSEKATERLAQLPELTLAKCIKVPSEIKALIIPSLPIPGHILDRQNMLWAFLPMPHQKLLRLMLDGPVDTHRAKEFVRL
jgi:hypothetical protein